MKVKFLSILGIISTLCFNSTALANNVDVNSYSVAGSMYYSTGLDYLKSHKYTEAIFQFRSAIRENPTDKSSRIQLVNAYISRAMYYNNKANDYNKAANDLRSAIFYMKYYECAPVEAKYSSNINKLEENLSAVLGAMGVENTSKSHYTIAKSLRAQGEFPAAAVEFHKALNDPEYRFKSLSALGYVYDVLHLNDQAASYLEQALAINSEDIDLHLKLAQVYENMGLLDKSANEYSVALSHSPDDDDILTSLEAIWREKISKYPNDAEAYSNLGAILQKKGDFNNALSYYEKAEQLNPSSITTRLNIGTLYQAKKEYDTAIEAYDTIIDFNPNYMLAYLYKAQCYSALGNTNAALETYKLALNLEPNNKQIKTEMNSVLVAGMSPEEKLAHYKNKVTTSPDNADYLYKYAYELHKANKLSDAILYYNKALAISPKNEDAYINLAQAYKQTLDFDNAKLTLTNAKKMFPDSEMIQKQLGVVNSEAVNTLYTNAGDLFNAGKYQEAISTYKKISPATAESYVGIGACYQALNDFKQAADYFKKSLAIDSSNLETMYYLALAYSNNKNFNDAKMYANRILAKNPNYEDAKNLLTYVIEQENMVAMDVAIENYEQGHYDEAIRLLNNVIAQDSQDSNAYYYRAMVYDAKKDYNSAIADYKKALEFNPQMLTAYYSIAVDYDYLGKYVDSLSYYKKYLDTTQKIGETNDCTRYSAQRIQDLKNYEQQLQSKR